jgi:hypothetical protein
MEYPILLRELSSISLEPLLAFDATEIVGFPLMTDFVFGRLFVQRSAANNVSRHFLTYRNANVTIYIAHYFALCFEDGNHHWCTSACASMEAKTTLPKRACLLLQPYAQGSSVYRQFSASTRTGTDMECHSDRMSWRVLLFFGRRSCWSMHVLDCDACIPNLRNGSSSCRSTRDPLFHLAVRPNL